MADQFIAPKYRNYTEFFKEPKEVWVRNVADGLVSMQIPIGNGVWEPVKLPYNRNPYNLTQRCPFDAIKNATDIRRLMMRRPSAIELLTEEEAMQVFTDVARAEGWWVREGGKIKKGKDGKAIPDREYAMEKAMQEQRDLMLGLVPGENSEERAKLWEGDRIRIDGSENLTTAPEEDAPAEKRQLTDDDIVTPKVLGTLRYVAPDMPDKEKWPVKQVLNELKKVATFSIADAEYTIKHGYYPSVVKWAKQMKAQLDGTAPEEPVDESTESTEEE